MAGEQAVEAVRSAVTDAAARLRAAAVPDEALGDYTPERRKLVFTRAPRMAPLGRAWRLGVFLIDRNGTLYAAGHSTRAIEPGRSNHQSVSGEERRAQRRAAHRGRFTEGETVNFDARVIDLSVEALAEASGPLFLSEGRALVRWNPTADAATAIEFGPYLRERLELLLNPPAGA